MSTFTKKETLALLDTQVLGENWNEKYITKQIAYTLNIVREKLIPNEVSYSYMIKTLSLRSEVCIMDAMDRIQNFIEKPSDEKIDKLIRSMYHEMNDAISDWEYRKEIEVEFNEREKTCYFAYTTICIKILDVIESEDDSKLFAIKEWYRLFIECYYQNQNDLRYFPNVGSSFFFNRLKQLIEGEITTIKLESVSE